MTARQVLVLGSHPSAGFSMTRYSELLRQAYSEMGHGVELLAPSDIWSRRAPKSLAKWVVYAEKFLIFPFHFRRARRGASLVHIADHSDAIYALQMARSPNVVVTCHDLLAVRAALGEFPEHRPKAIGRFYQRLVVRGLGRCSRILSVSTATAEDVQRLTKACSAVLPNPIPPSFAPLIPSLPETGTRDEGSFFLVVSTQSWRKRRETNIEAWNHLRRTKRFQDAGLVIVGPPLDSCERQMLTEMNALDRVSVLHNVSDDELSGLYGKSSGVLALTRYEGFGWPIIESQLHGKVPLTTNAPVFRETGGAGALYLDLDRLATLAEKDWEDLADGLGSLEAREQAHQNLSRFSWTSFVGRLRRLTLA